MIADWDVPGKQQTAGRTNEIVTRASFSGYVRKGYAFMQLLWQTSESGEPRRSQR
jgi:hypothetical protein